MSLDNHLVDTVMLPIFTGNQAAAAERWHSDVVLLIMVYSTLTEINSLPNDKILDWSKLKAFADNKITMNEKLKFALKSVGKNCGKRRKCWLPAFSSFPTMFSKVLLIRGRCQDCVVKS